MANCERSWSTAVMRLQRGICSKKIVMRNGMGKPERQQPVPSQLLMDFVRVTCGSLLMWVAWWASGRRVVSKRCRVMRCKPRVPRSLSQTVMTLFVNHARADWLNTKYQLAVCPAAAPPPPQARSNDRQLRIHSVIRCQWHESTLRTPILQMRRTTRI